MPVYTGDLGTLGSPNGDPCGSSAKCHTGVTEIDFQKPIGEYDQIFLITKILEPTVGRQI